MYELFLKLRNIIAGNRDLNEFMRLMRGADQKTLKGALSCTDESGQALVHYAATFGDPKILQALVNAGADINQAQHHTILTVLNCCLPDNGGRGSYKQADEENAMIFLRTNLDRLEKTKDEKVKEELRQLLNHKDPSGNTFLHHAIARRFPGVCELLLKLGADPNLASNNVSPMRQAVDALSKENRRFSCTSFQLEGGLKRIIPLLMNSGANLKEMYNEKESLLAWLANSVRLQDLPGLSVEMTRYFVMIRDLILAAHRNDQKRINTDLFGYKLDLEGSFQGITSEEIINSYSSFCDFEENPGIRRELNELLLKSEALYNPADIHQDKEAKRAREKMGGGNSAGPGTRDLGAVDPTVRGDVKHEAEKRERKERKDIQELSDIDMQTQVQIDLSNMGMPVTQGLFDQNQKLHQITALPVLTTVYKEGDHAMCYLFLDDLCLRINRGGTVDPRLNKSGIQIFKMNTPQYLPTERDRFLNSQAAPITDDYLLHTLPGVLGFEEIGHDPMVAQTVGNCCWRSAESQVKAIIMMNFYRRFLEHRQQLGDNIKDPAVMKECMKDAQVYSEVWYRRFLLYDLQYSLRKCERFSKNIPKGLLAGMKDKVQVAEKAYQESARVLDDYIRVNAPVRAEREKKRSAAKVLAAAAAAVDSRGVPLPPAELPHSLPFYQHEWQKLLDQQVKLGTIQANEVSAIERGDVIATTKLFQALHIIGIAPTQDGAGRSMSIVVFGDKKTAEAFSQKMVQDRIFGHAKQARQFDPEKVKPAVKP